jgi:hypothetical protein
LEEAEERKEEERKEEERWTLSDVRVRGTLFVQRLFPRSRSCS